MNTKETILNDLRYIAQRLSEMHIKGTDATLMHETFLALQDIERVLNIEEDPKGEE